MINYGKQTIDNSDIKSVLEFKKFSYSRARNKKFEQKLKKYFGLNFVLLFQVDLLLYI